MAKIKVRILNGTSFRHRLYGIGMVLVNTMPHPRKRHAAPLCLKKLKFAPVLAIQGARQTGKTFLARELLTQWLPNLEYVSFDQFKTVDFASRNPGVFLSQHQNAFPFAIDEAQKVPQIFDEVKFEVDQNRIPGKFILLGSTEFSKMNLIRESLTGRMSRIRIFPLNLAEACELPENSSQNVILCQEKPRIQRAQFLQYLARGGMPGIFAVRNENERNSLLKDWIDLTTQRDATQFPKIKIDSTLCARILQQIAILEEPDAGQIAKALKIDLRRIKTHLEVLQILFAIHPLDPHPLGTGKTIYFLCDVALARVLGASFETQLYTWLVQEQLSQRSYRDDRDTQLYYYRTPKGSRIHLLLENPIQKKIAALKLLDEERFSEKNLEILKAFKKKAINWDVSLFALGASRISLKTDKIEIFTWESLG